MVKSWLAYLLTLGCGAAFYLFYPKPLSVYTLLLLLVLPLISLGLTAVFLRRLKLEISHDATLLRLSLRGPRSARGTRARLSCRLENKLYPQLSQDKLLTLVCNAPQTLELPTGHFGWLSFSVKRCVLTDWMGLFPVQVKLPAPVLVLLWPQSDPSGAAGLDLSPTPGLALWPRPGGGPGEDYELRPYRPGDAVTSIHWKLTAKQPDDGDPILRETLEPLGETIAVTYDHFGDPDEVDALLCQLEALERRLMDNERPFTLCWADPGSGGITYYDIDCPDAWQRCRRALAAVPAPLTGQGVPQDVPLVLPGHSGAVRRIHLIPDNQGNLPQKEVSL